MTFRIVVVAEDRLGFVLARDLSDRVIEEKGPPWVQDLWSDPSTRRSMRTWQGLEETSEYGVWKAIKRTFDGAGLRAHGMGLPGWGLAAFKVVLLASRMDPAPDALVLCLDTDGHPRRDGLLEGLRRASERGLTIPTFHGRPVRALGVGILAGELSTKPGRLDTDAA